MKEKEQWDDEEMKGEEEGGSRGSSERGKMEGKKKGDKVRKEMRKSGRMFHQVLKKKEEENKNLHARRIY